MGANLAPLPQVELPDEGRESGMAKVIWAIIGVVCLVLAIDLTVQVHNDHVLGFDYEIYDFLFSHVISGGFTPWVIAVTSLSSAFVLIAITIGILAAVPNKRIGIAVAVNLICEALLNTIIKNLMQRPRPAVQHITEEHGYSFPSGHAMASTAFYGFLIYLVFSYMKNRTAKCTLIVLMCLLVPCIMASRVYLGVHFASDVLAGFLYSMAYLTLFYIPVLAPIILTKTRSKTA